jgi:hypothetical protein
MGLPHIPTPEKTLADLSWLHPEIYRAFEHGVYKGKTHFDSENLEWDASAFSTIVRLHAKSYLKTKNLDAVEIEHVNLSGLSLRVPKYQIKMWKSEGSDLPVPGDSEPKQEFYQQPLFPNGTQQLNPLRLAVLWNIDWQKNLAAVWLVCPKYGDEKSAEAHWCVKIPDPALASVPVVAAASVASDLPIKLKHEKATGTTDN